MPFRPKGVSGGQTDKQTNRKMDERTNGRAEKWTNRQTEVRTTGLRELYFKLVTICTGSVNLAGKLTSSNMDPIRELWRACLVYIVGTFTLAN